MKIQLPENLKAGDVIEFGNFPPGIPESAKLVWQVGKINHNSQDSYRNMNLSLFVESVYWRTFYAQETKGFWRLFPCATT